MSLEDRILQRWHKLCEGNYIPFPLNEETLKLLIAIALEEVQRGIVEPRFTTQEAVEVESAFSLLQMALANKKVVAPDIRLAILEGAMTPAVLSALDKLRAHLDDQVQAQRMMREDLDGIIQEMPTRN